MVDADLELARTEVRFNNAATTDPSRDRKGAIDAGELSEPILAGARKSLGGLRTSTHAKG
jgi:hypothetical protein